MSAYKEQNNWRISNTTIVVETEEDCVLTCANFGQKKIFNLHTCQKNMFETPSV